SVPAGSAEVFAVHDGGAYGVTADVIYRSPSVQHLVAAKLSATGYPATVEMYQAGVDDDGPSQHPRVAAGEQLFLTAFAIPTCTPDVGLAPVLRLSAESVDGVAVPFDVPVTDWRGVLPATTRVWCARGVMAAMQAGRGTS